MPLKKIIAHNPSKIFVEARQKSITLKKEFKLFLNERSFKDLTFKEQLKFCKLNKNLGDIYWSCFLLAKKDKNYQIAIRFYDKAFELCNDNARDMFVDIKGKVSSSSLRTLANFKNNYTYYKALQKLFGIGVKQNLQDAIAMLVGLSYENDARASFKLGICYTEGVAVNRDSNKAFEFTKAAAEKEVTNAYNYLATLYEDGKGTTKDSEQANLWVQKGADLGHKRALKKIGYNHLKCKNPDYSKAVQYLKLSAMQGDSGSIKKLEKINTIAAQYELALLKRNYFKAIELALKNSDIQKQFFEYDLEEILPDENCLKELVDFFEGETSLSGISNETLIDLLVTLNMYVRKNIAPFNDLVVNIQTYLLSLIDVSKTEKYQITAFLNYFAHLYLDFKCEKSNEHNITIEHIFTLWYLSQAYRLTINDGLLKLLSSLLVSHFFNNACIIKCLTKFSAQHFSALVFGFHSNSKISMDELNTLLHESLIIPSHSTESPQIVLLQLKYCIANSEIWGGKIPLYIVQMSQCLAEISDQDGPVDNKVAQSVLAKLMNGANLILDKKTIFSLIQTKKSN